jgi:hypothetical protein
MMGAMRFTLRDIFAVTFLVALVAGVFNLTHRLHSFFGDLLFAVTMSASFFVALLLITRRNSQN